MEQNQIIPNSPELSDYEKILHFQADLFNSKKAKDVDNPQCPHCLDREYIYAVEGCALVAKECACKAAKDSARALQRSGLTDKLAELNLETYRVDTDWQRRIRDVAVSFLVESEKWFFIGGQVGCGKTHICTAILNRMIEAGRRVRYMVWPDEVDAIKGNAEDFSKALQRLMTVDVLYIDDFLKSANGQESRRRPTEGEMNAAFKLINYRYNRRELVTLISSEYSIERIMGFDSGLGSRIYERCRDYQLEIGPDERKNVRVYGV